MKIRLNKKTIAALPAEVRTLVLAWKEQWHKAAFAVKYASRFYVEEDARFTGFSADLKKSLSIRAAGEWAGLTELTPGSHCPLPPGCTMVATGFFCGEPWLTIYHNPSQGISNYVTWQFGQLAELQGADVAALPGGRDSVPNQLAPSRLETTVAEQ